MADKNPAFAVKPDDPKDVSWGLTTADACWKRGERSEALKWLRRAVEAASEAECDARALELAKVAADLATQIGSMAPPAPAASPPVAVPVAPKPLAARFSGGTPPRPAAVVGSAVSRSPQVKETPKRERKSITNEGPKSRASQVDKAEKAEKAALLDKTHDDKSTHPFADIPAPRSKRSNSKVDKGEKAEGRTEMRKLTRADEIDAWPTEVVAGHDLPVPDVGAQTDMSIPKPSGVVRATQAVRVLVWKHADGSVRIAAVASGRAVPSDAVEATLAALDTGADLVTLLS
jgi:hypothetical protein